MNTLIFWIFIYILISIGIGIFASRKVKDDTDYILAGRGLTLPIVIATTFATWFGSEAILWVPATFQEEWLLGILADPFGAGLCLILVGLFFAKPLYNLWVKTLWDFYKMKYGRGIELAASIMIICSYIGWVSAQIVALGLIFDILTTGSAFDSISQLEWSMIGGAIVLIYTIFGGMWSVAMTDFFQMIIITIGVLIASFFITNLPGAEGFTSVIAQAASDGKFDLLPEWLSFGAIMAILTAILTMWFGSIPQQDVFQRVLSANSSKNARFGAIIGGSMYILVAFIPLILGYAAIMVAPDIIANTNDTQRILPTLILEKTPIFVQILFFGALISAIMSTASGTLLAPSALFMENVARPFFPNMSAKKALFLTRTTVLGFFVIILSFVWYKYLNEEANIFQMVENAYKVTLAGAFVPLVMGVYIKKVYTISATLSMITGIGTWLMLEFILKLEHIFTMEPHFFGFIISILGFLAGQIYTKLIQNKKTST